MKFNFDKKYLVIGLSGILLIASGIMVGWIIGKERSKSTTERSASRDVDNKQKSQSSGNQSDIEIPSEQENVVVSNKEEAGKAVEDMDSIIDSMGSDLEN